MILRSVRSRLTIAVTMMASVAFIAIAVLAPGVVADVLEDDLIDAELSNASFFIGLNEVDVFDADDIIRDANGEVIVIPAGPGGLSQVLSNAVEVGTSEEVLNGFPIELSADVVFNADDPFFEQFIDETQPLADEFAADQMVLLREANGLDLLTEAAGGPFAIELQTFFVTIVDTDGSFEAVPFLDEFPDMPFLTAVELDEYLFDDLGLFFTDEGSLVDTDVPSRLVAATAVDDLGVELLVVADASSVDRSVDRIRTALWFAVPFLIAAVAGVSWLLASRSLRPVRSITEQAATISGGSLDARVPVPNSGDEIATLATTVNEMLDRLESDDRTRRRFISDASHELRSPVAVMRNEAEVALHHPGQTDVSELATTVSDESKRMAMIIDDLLALARYDEGVPRPDTEVDLDDIVLTEAARSRRVRVDASGVSAGRVHGRSDEIGRMVGHLLDNAARHAASEVSVSLVTTIDAVVLTVDDDGPGVADVDRDRIFERFARLDEARTRDRGGAGLGLAVVRSIAERSGGSVDVAVSHLGGARFTVSFPH